MLAVLMKVSSEHGSERVGCVDRGSCRDGAGTGEKNCKCGREHTAEYNLKKFDSTSRGRSSETARSLIE